MTITASLFAINGAVITLVYPLDTLLPLLPYLGPSKQMGPAQSELFPFAPVVAIRNETFPVASIVSVIMAIFLIYSELNLELNDWIKVILLVTTGIVCMTQLSMVQPGSWLIISGIVLMFSKKTRILP